LQIEIIGLIFVIAASVLNLVKNLFMALLKKELKELNYIEVC
jgi:hypothetical protein